MNFWHHRFCAKCGKYTVHDAGNCIICKEQDAIIKKIEDEIPKSTKINKP